MDIAPVSVTHELTLQLVSRTGALVPLQAELVFDAEDPFAVTAHFDTDRSDVIWVIGRELLFEGMFRPVGDGDVHVWPCLDTAGRAVTVLELVAPHGQAVLQVPSYELQQFLRRTEVVVSPGAEADYLDVDAVISRLLG